MQKVRKFMAANKLRTTAFARVKAYAVKQLRDYGKHVISYSDKPEDHALADMAYASSSIFDCFAVSETGELVYIEKPKSRAKNNPRKAKV